MKKPISIILALVMIFTCTNVVLAQDSKEALIASTKERLEISSDFTNFYIQNTIKDDNLTSYSLEWTKPIDNNKEDIIDVSVCDNGFILGYNYSQHQPNDITTVYSFEEGQKAADSFLKRIMGDDFNSLEYDYLYPYNNAYEFLYKIKLNNTPIYNYFVEVDVNRYTNQVISYTYPEEIYKLTTASSSLDNIKTLDEATSFFKDNLELGYITLFDDELKAYVPKLVYRYENTVVQAKDFSPFKEHFVYTTYDEAGAADNGYEITEEEKQEIGKNNSAFSVDEALKIANSTFATNLTDKDVDYTYYKIDDDSYNLAIYSSEANIELVFNPQGKIIGYYSYNFKSMDIENPISSQQAQEIAEKLLQTLDYDYTLAPCSVDFESYYKEYSFKYNLVRNNIKSFEEYIKISVNGCGEITSIYSNLLDNVFKDVTINPQISKEQAFDLISKSYNIELKYALDYNESSDKQMLTPIYGYNYAFCVDALTGEILASNGTHFAEASVKEYTDLSNQWYADIAQKLIYMGYSYDDEVFDGDSLLTYEALEEIYTALYYYNDNVDPQGNITRYEFAEMLLDEYDVHNVNTLNEIYTSPFSDVDYEHTGTVAILKGLGIVTGDSFRGNDYITRAEAAVMIYRLLTLK